MTTTPMWRRYLRLWGTDPPADIDTELAFHLEELTQCYIARGMSLDQARAQALQRFGNVARVRAETLTVDEGSVRAARRRDVLDALWHDFRDACHWLTRNPGFTVGAALMLALGIGFNTTIYSVNKALLFPAVPIGDAQRVVSLWSQNIARGIFATPLSEGEFAEVAAEGRSFEAVAAYTVQQVTLTGGAAAERIPAVRSTTNLFPLLQVSTVMGRLFGPEDAVRDGNPVAILSYRTWQNRFGSDAEAVGKDIHLNGRPHTIIGVMPEPFWFSSRDIEVWLPLPAPRADGDRNLRMMTAVARLGRDVNSQAAQADMQALAERLAHDHPQTNAGWAILVTGLLPLGPGERIFFVFLTTITGLLLAAACAHIANLLLARGMERRGEIAIRAALGAGRGRIVRQLLVESVALSAVGGVCSLLVAVPLLGLIRRVLGPRTPFLSDLALDGVALGVTIGLSLLATVLFGLAPAIRVSSVTASDAIKQPPGGPITGRRRRLASLLIGTEAAVATLALIVTVLFTRSAINVLAVPIGFEPEQVMTFRIEVPDYKYADPEAAARVLTAIQQRLLKLPFVTASGASVRMPLYSGPGLPTDTLTLEDRQDIRADQRPWAITSVVTPGYFESLHIPVRQGRSFDARDAATSVPAVVVSRSLASAYWPNQDVVGRRLRIGGGDAAWLTVIGVVDDVRPFDPTSPQVRDLYLPFAQRSVRDLTYFVATRDDPTNRLQEVRLAVRDVDPELPVLDLQTLTEAISRLQASSQLGQRAMQINVIIAILLAITGVYSVGAFAVVCRRREIAIRVALGGARARIMALLLRQAVRPAFLGVGIGVVLSGLVSRAAALVLYDVNPLDPLTYGLSAGSLCLAAAAASCFPAIRATRGNVAAALRSE